MRIDQTNRTVKLARYLYDSQTDKDRNYLRQARYVFEELNYRRYEWKCDASISLLENQPRTSGFYLQPFPSSGYLGRTRDTDWMSMIDKDWPQVREE